MPAIAFSAFVAAEETPNYTYDSLKPGPMAFIVMALLAVAVFFLVRSMLKQLRRVDFDEQAETDAERAKSHRQKPDRPKAPS
jgi:hypothetical protein